MSDRFPSDRRARTGERPEDAVFEDVGHSGDGAGDLPVWESLGEPEPTAQEPVVIDAFEPSSGDGVSQGDGKAPFGYTPGDRFRIDFDEPPAVPSTALAPIPRRARPETQAGAVIVPPVQPPALPRAEARRSAIDKVRMLRRHKWLILVLSVLGLALGYLYTLLTPSVYEAHSLLLINPASEEGDIAAAPGAEESRVLNQALVIQQAPQIAEETARILIDRPEASGLAALRDATEAYGDPLTVESLADFIQEEVVTVEPAADEADAIRVAAVAETPEEAALIARLYTDEYTDLTQSTLRDRSTRTREALEEEIARAEGELSEIEQQLQSYMTRRNAAGLDDQTRVTVSQIGQLQSQLDIARAEAQTHRARLSQLRADLASVPARLEQSAAVPSAVETADLDTRIAADERLLEQIYTQNPELRGNPAGHPNVAAIDQRLRDLKAERRQRIAQRTDAAVAAGGLDLSSTEANGQAYLASLRTQISAVSADLAGAQARAATLSSRLGQARGQLQAVPEQRVQLDRLERQREATAATLRQLQQEKDRASLSETTELGFAQVIRDVRVPREPKGPGLLGNLAVGGLLGFLLGLGLAFVRHQTDNRVFTPDDLRDNGFTVVGTVPDLTKALRGGRQQVEGASVHPGLVALTQPLGAEAEGFRHLQAALAAGPQAPQVVLVGAPGAHAGKSLVATNLAVVA
ncbi:MAG: Wzz/FepE/Etk N-terminal domain-containing protein, partial [Bacteroidota bacterium]